MSGDSSNETKPGLSCAATVDASSSTAILERPSCAVVREFEVVAGIAVLLIWGPPVFWLCGLSVKTLGFACGLDSLVDIGGPGFVTVGAGLDFR